MCVGSYHRLASPKYYIYNSTAPTLIGAAPGHRQCRWSAQFFVRPVKFTPNRDDRIEAIHFRHRQVHQGDVRTERAKLVDRLTSIRSFRDYVHFRNDRTRARRWPGGAAHGRPLPSPNQGGVGAHDFIAASFPENFSDNFSSSGPASANKILRN